MPGSKIPSPILIDLDWQIGRISYSMDYSKPVGKTREGTKEFGAVPNSLLIICPPDDDLKPCAIYLNRKGMRALKKALNEIEIPEDDE